MIAPKVITVLLTCTFANIFASLPAPTLLQLTSIDTCVGLNWRLNSSSYSEIAILRKRPGTDQFAAIGTASGSASSWIDCSVAGGTVYHYALRARSAGDSSEISNVDSILTNARVFKNPQITKCEWDESRKGISISFVDSSDCEDGFILYRSEDNGDYVVSSRLPPRPGKWSTVDVSDSTVLSNAWYKYMIVALRGPDTLESTPPSPEQSSISMAFTFVAESFLPESLPMMRLTEKLGSLPVYWGGWATKSGNTILLRETNAPRNAISQIDVSTPSSPLFKGYVSATDTVLTSGLYSTGSGVKTCQDSLLIMAQNPGVLRIFRNTGSVMVSADTLKIDSIAISAPSTILDDSLLLFACSNASGQYPVVIRNGRFIFMKQVWRRYYDGLGLPSIYSYLEHGKRILGQYMSYQTGGYQSYSVTLVDYSHDPWYPNAKTVQKVVWNSQSVTMPAPPKYSLPPRVGPYHLPEYAFTAAFNDVGQEILFLFTDTSLEVYRYTVSKLDGQLDSYSSNRVLGRNPFLPRGGERLRHTAIVVLNGRFIRDPREGLATAVYDLRGRRIAPRVLQQSSRMQPAKGRFPNGVYVETGRNAAQ